MNTGLIAGKVADLTQNVYRNAYIENILPKLHGRNPVVV